MPHAFTDHYGMTISTDHTHAAQCWQEGLDRLLSQNAGAHTKFEEAIALDDGLAMAYGGLAVWYMQRAQPGEARSNIQRALALAAGITRRERQQLEIINLWIQGQGHQALALLIEHLAEFPRDALLMRLAHLLHNRGSSAGVANFPAAFLAPCMAVRLIATTTGHFWPSMPGRTTRPVPWTKRCGWPSALWRSIPPMPWRRTPWPMCTLNAVMPGLGQTCWGTGCKGLTIRRRPMSISPGTWPCLNWHWASTSKRWRGMNVTFVHPSWPKACPPWPIAPPCSGGCRWYGPHPRRWLLLPCPGKRYAFAAPMAEHPGFAFQVAHAAFALAACEDHAGLTMMLEHLQRSASQEDLFIRDMVIPLVQGIGDFAQGEYARAAQVLEPVCPQLVRIGGSHAQREVFEDTLLEAYLRAEQFAKAAAMLEERLTRRASVRDTFWLGRAQAGQGQSTQAQASFTAAAQGWCLGDATSSEMVALQRQYHA